MNANIKGNFQICIIEPLRKKSFFLKGSRGGGGSKQYMRGLHKILLKPLQGTN